MATRLSTWKGVGKLSFCNEVFFFAGLWMMLAMQMFVSRYGCANISRHDTNQRVFFSFRLLGRTSMKSVRLTCFCDADAFPFFTSLVHNCYQILSLIDVADPRHAQHEHTPQPRTSPFSQENTASSSSSTRGRRMIWQLRANRE